MRICVVSTSGVHGSSPQSNPQMSKSRFVAGVQCPKLLWWKVHEPDAVELQPDKRSQHK